MGCCGQKRAAASVALRRRDRSAAPQRAAPRVASASALAAGRPADVPLRYLGVRAVRVRGSASGRVYHASSTRPSITIDARDVAALIRTGLFG